jgi:hypothetical protein
MIKYLRCIAIITCMSYFPVLSFGQSVEKLEKVSDNRLVSILNDLDILAEKKTSNLSIRLFSVNNPSGSAGLPNCEVTNSIYIAVSEIDIAPEQSLHKYGPVYDPKVLNLDGQPSEQVLTIESGHAESRKQVKIRISIEKVTVMK